jgi:hypothetical protein
VVLKLHRTHLILRLPSPHYPLSSRGEATNATGQATVHTEVHDVEARTCMMHASSTSDTVIGPYGNEYALVLKFSEDGSKVEKFEEFVDSGYSEKFFVRLAEAGKAKQGGGA